MKKRIFIALRISKELQMIIDTWREKHDRLSVRWTPLKDLHITFTPPWYEENVDSVIKKIRTLKDAVEAFYLTFEKVSYGPSQRKPRLVWAEGRMPTRFLRLRDTLESLLKKEARQRSPKIHLTLARFNSRHFSSFPLKEIHDRVDWKEKVESFSLLESQLKKTGAEYSTLAEIKLAAS